jgi:hypothetical protein
LFVGISILAAGLAMQYVPAKAYDAMQICTHPRGNLFPPGLGEFVPGSTFTAICPYNEAIGQDLTFWAILRGQAAIPARVEIRDPDNELLASNTFNSSRIVMSVTPKSFGNYSATITSLADKMDSNFTDGSGHTIFYAFGHLTSGSFEGVVNPVGDAIVWIRSGGYFLTTAGFILVVYSLARIGYARAKRGFSSAK